MYVFPPPGCFLVLSVFSSFQKEKERKADKLHALVAAAQGIYVATPSIYLSIYLSFFLSFLSIDNLCALCPVSASYHVLCTGAVLLGSLSIHPPVYLSIYPSIHPSIYRLHWGVPCPVVVFCSLALYPSIHLSIYLSIYLLNKLIVLHALRRFRWSELSAVSRCPSVCLSTVLPNCPQSHLRFPLE